ncbi:hypothetical protein [Streptomyces rubiginosohelvolus]
MVAHEAKRQHVPGLDRALQPSGGQHPVVPFGQQTQCTHGLYIRSIGQGGERAQNHVQTGVGVRREGDVEPLVTLGAGGESCLPYPLGQEARSGPLLPQVRVQQVFECAEAVDLGNQEAGHGIPRADGPSEGGLQGLRPDQLFVAAGEIVLVQIGDQIDRQSIAQACQRQVDGGTDQRGTPGVATHHRGAGQLLPQLRAGGEGLRDAEIGCLTEGQTQTVVATGT